MAALRVQISYHLNTRSFVEPQLLFLSSEWAAADDDFESVFGTATFAAVYR